MLTSNFIRYTALEAEIDQLVYQLYDLSDEEIEIIEQSWENKISNPSNSMRLENKLD